jgi:hypothetical protein
MPRKVQPRWGDTGVAGVLDFKLSAGQLAALAGILEIDSPATIAKLKPSLESFGARYLLWLKQDENGPSRAEQNAGLKKLLASPQDAIGILARLDYATQGRVLDVLWTHPCRGSGEVVEQLHEVTDDTLEHVLYCAELALADGQKRRGPPPRKTLRIVMEQLATLYEEATGLAFTHTPYVKSEYKGISQSRAGRFVTAFLKIVEPQLPETAIATEMARVVKWRKRKGQGTRQNCPVQTI